jgi:two-component system response regulator FlrC
METILITDDDDACRDTIQRTLEREGYVVEGVNGVDDALDAIHRRRFDLIVCDYWMVGKTGFDLLSELQKQGPQIPVLMVSACPDPVLDAVAVELGAAGLLRKPFRRRDLVASIARALS